MEHAELKHHVTHHGHKAESENIFRLAASATLHCLIGCGLGEVSGMIISVIIGLGMMDTMILSVVLGFIGGISLGIVPLLRKGWNFSFAIKTIIAAEGLSIAVMEAFEIGTQVAIPGVMEAGLTDGIFWMGMGLSLIVGYIAAFPINYVMIKKGVRHVH